MKWFLMLTGCCFFLLPAFAQKERHPLVDSIEFRNELDIQAAPVIGFATAGMPPVQPVFSLGYKRNFGRFHYLRVGLTSMHYGNTNSPGISMDPYFDAPYPAADTTVYFDQQAGNFSTQYWYPSVYIGHEHLFGRRRARFLVGFDVLLGATRYDFQNTYGLFDVTHIRDSFTGHITSTVVQTDAISEAKTGWVFHLGVRLRVGFRYEISRRLAFSASVAPMLYVYPGKLDIQSFPYQRVEFFFPALVPDVSLHIKL